MAEVSLVFDNADKSIPLEFDEVVITRKLYRSGGDYLVNGAAVRLLDVVDLLAQMGIGRRVMMWWDRVWQMQFYQHHR